MKRENEMLDLIAVMRTSERKIVAAMIEDRLAKLAKANHRLLNALDQIPVEIQDNTEIEAILARKISIMRIELEIPKAVYLYDEGIRPSQARDEAALIPRWLRGMMNEEEIEDWFFRLSETLNVDCGWVFFESPCNYYNSDPKCEATKESDVLKWMIEIGTRKQEQ